MPDPRPTSLPAETALALRAQLDAQSFESAMATGTCTACDRLAMDSRGLCAVCARVASEAARPTSMGIDPILLADLNDEERSALANLLCPAVLVMSDEAATMLELTAAEQTIELFAAALRMRRLMLALGGER